MNYPKGRDPIIDQRRAYFGSGTDQAMVSGVMTADCVGQWINVLDLGQVGFDMSWPATGTPIGVFFFRISNDEVQPVGETAGLDSGLSGWANATGVAGSNFITIDLNRLRCKWIMLWYDRTSGGTDATLTVRVVGGGR